MRSVQKVEDLLGIEPKHISRWRSESADMPVLLPWCYPVTTTTCVLGDVPIEVVGATCPKCLRKAYWHNVRISLKSRIHHLQMAAGHIVFTAFEGVCAALEWFQFDD